MKIATVMTIAALLLAEATSGQTPHQPTFLGHWLGETYDEFLKAKVGTIDPAPYISGPCNGANDDPSSCLADPLIISGRSAVVVVHNDLEITFVFTDSRLVEMHTDGCGEGSGQATLLTARFGRPSEVVRTPYQNGFGAGWVNTKWMWHLSPNVELYVEEDRSPRGGSCPSEPFVYISFSRPEPKKKVVNPYSQPSPSKSRHNPIST